MDEQDDLADDAAAEEDEEALGLLAAFHRDVGGGDVLREPPVEVADREEVLAVDDPRRGRLDGYSSKEISAKLNMTSGQVNNVVASIYRKLGIHGKAELKKLV